MFKYHEKRNRVFETLKYNSYCGTHIYFLKKNNSECKL